MDNCIGNKSSFGKVYPLLQGKLGQISFSVQEIIAIFRGKLEDSLVMDVPTY